MMSNPALLLIAAAIAVPMLRGRPRVAVVVAAPIAGMIELWMLDFGSHGTIDYLGLTLDPLRVDGLSRTFATAFLLAALLTSIYGLHLRDPLQQAVIPLYAPPRWAGSSPET